MLGRRGETEARFGIWQRGKKPDIPHQEDGEKVWQRGLCVEVKDGLRARCRCV